MNTAPILLFVYNRPLHTLMTVGALAQNEWADQSDLIIYADGPKKPEHNQNVQAVRTIIRNIKGFRSVKIIEQSKNLGLSASILHGVTEQVNQHGKVIVLEDDLLTSPCFLRYMNEALDKYEKVGEVISIHGYSYPVQIKHSESYFLKGADCWGWATWKRGWAELETLGTKLKKELEQSKSQYAFDFNGNYPYTQMLDKQIEGKNDSWAILWYASAFLKDKLTLYPAQSLVQNIGLDASGTHSKTDFQFLHESLALTVPALTDQIRPDVVAFDTICAFFKNNRRPKDILKRLISKL